MATIFGEGKIFWKLQRVHSLDTLWVENFDEIALSRTVKEIEANLCFAIFGKIRKFKMAAIFGEGKIFWKLPRIQCSDTLWVENLDEIALSRTVKEIEANLQTLSNGQMLIRSARTGPPNVRKRRPVSPPARPVQYCVLARWRVVLPSCLDRVTS